MVKKRKISHVLLPAIFYVFTQHFTYGLASDDIILTRKFLTKPPFYSGMAVTFQSAAKVKTSTSKVAENVEIKWDLPSFVEYKTHTVQSDSKTPTLITTTSSQINVKFSTLTNAEKMNIHVNITMDPKGTIHDNRFHYGWIGETFTHSWVGLCDSQDSIEEDLNFAFFASECSNFGSIDIKDSHVKASTAKTYQSDNRTWTPMPSFLLLNEKRTMKINFFQVELASSKDVSMVAIRGLPGQDPIPKDIIKLSFSKNNWKWKTRRKFQTVELIEGDDEHDDVTVAVTMKKPIRSRYIRINLPPFGITAKHLMSFEVELFACDPNSVTSNTGSIVPVGIESSALVPDAQFSAQPVNSQYQASQGRLNAKTNGRGWCAVSCDSTNHLQIDLGDFWKIVEVETQSLHASSNDVNAVKTYSLAYSQDATVWTTYKVNGGTKIFWGNDVTNIATRHKLLIPIIAKFVRFVLKTCVGNPCLRVELYGTKVSKLEKKEVPVVFERSLLVKKGVAYVCSTEVKRNKPNCYYSDNKGVSWKELTPQILNVIAYDPVNKILFGLSQSGKNYMKSLDPQGKEWRGIPAKEWTSIQYSPTLITAVHIPLVPISRAETTAVDSIVQMNGLKGDLWLVDQVAVYFKPSGGTPKIVLFLLPPPTDLSSNPCHTGVCLNGYCEKLSKTDFKCHCMPGFTGQSCDTGINECSSNPCQNGGGCTDGHLNYTCSCLAGYSGVHCQDFDECSSNPCQNGGTCIDGDNKYTCSCTSSYKGINCQDFDSCSSSPCLNQGTCTDTTSSFTCACAQGFSGTQCQVTPCTLNPCANGGTCNLTPGTKTGYTCDCTKDYSGLRCFYGAFVISRSNFMQSDPWKYNGKYDKLVFHSNANLTMYAICISDANSKKNSVCTLTSRVRKEGISNYLVSLTTNWYCSKADVGKVYCPRFASSIRLDVNTRYIFELTMTCSTNDLRKVVNGHTSPMTKTLPDGSNSITYSFETVSSAELADSTGATASFGGIPGIVAQFAHN